jgi:hypothetical protein
MVLISVAKKGQKCVISSTGGPMRIWCDISKVSENDDGTVTVSGVASSNAVDSDGEVITAQAMADAIPDYMKFANIREMHQSIAAGTALSCEVREDGRTYLEAHVVDPVSVKKVLTNVLKGFSIGGKVTGRDPKDRKIITGLRLTEISLVDRPANPEATFSLAKLEDSMDKEPPTYTLEDLKKYAGEEIRDAGMALQCLDALFYLYTKEASEPGEPADQVEALGVAVAALRAFIASEIQEDNTNPDKTGTEEAAAVSMAAGTDGLEKGGARFSKQTVEAIGEIHKMIQKCDKAMTDLGYERKDEDEADGKEDDEKKAEQAAALAKAAKLEEDITKVTQERDDLMGKVAELEGDLTKARTDLASATLKLSEKPLKAVPVEKSEDTKIQKKESAPGEGETPANPLDAMRKVHASGGRILTTTRLG